jgi:hypothetical protein
VIALADVNSTEVRERIRLAAWARGVVEKEYGPHPGDTYRYSAAQIARNAAKRADRIRWLMLTRTDAPPPPVTERQVLDAIHAKAKSKNKDGDS